MSVPEVVDDPIDASVSTRDGDVPPVPNPGRTPAKKRRRPLLRIVTVLGTVVAVLLVSTIGVLYWRFRQIPRRNAGCLDQGSATCDPGVANAGDVPLLTIPIHGSTATPTTAKPKSGAAKSTTAAISTTPTTIVTGPLVDIRAVQRLGGPNSVNILILGLDTRSNVPVDQEKTFGNVGGSRTDTIMLLRIDRDANKAWVLSFPRDLFVRIAGTSDFNRLNAAYAKGLPTLVSTLRENFEVPVWHVVLVDFVGFQKVVGAIGGVTICFPLPSRDILSGLNQPPGCNLLDPKQATAYVRSRHLQTGKTGVWTDDPRGDFGRIERQQTFIRAALVRSVDQGFRNPVTLNAVLANLKDAIQIDNTFNFADVTSLANDFRSFNPDELQTFTVPATNRRIDGKDVLIMDPPKAAAVIGQFGRPASAGSK